MQETQVGSLGHKVPLEEEMETHSSILAWKIPWTEEPGGAIVHGVAKSQRPLSDWAAAAAAKSLQSCPTLCDPIDSSLPGSPIPGILQARILEWVAISFSNAWKWKVKVKSLSRVRLLATPWTAAYQAPPSMGFSRQEYWDQILEVSLDSAHVTFRVCLWTLVSQGRVNHEDSSHFSPG